MIDRWTRTMLRRRWVVAAWLSGLLTNRFSLPGTDTARAERILEEEFGQKSTGAFTVVVEGEPGSAQAFVPEVEAATRRAASELPTSQVAGVKPVFGSVVVGTIVSNLEPAGAKDHTAAMRRAAGDVPGAELYVSGRAAIEHDLDPVFSRDLTRSASSASRSR